MQILKKENSQILFVKKSNADWNSFFVKMSVYGQ